MSAATAARCWLCGASCPIPLDASAEPRCVDLVQCFARQVRPPGAPISAASAFDAWAAGKIKQAGGLTALEGAHLIGESEEALASEAADTLRAHDVGEEETT